MQEWLNALLRQKLQIEEAVETIVAVEDSFRED
jgi:hypothetical protein